MSRRLMADWRLPGVSLMVALSLVGAPGRSHGESKGHSSLRRSPVLVRPGPLRPSRIHADGRWILTRWEMRWRLMCRSAPGGVSEAQLAMVADRHERRLARMPPNDAPSPVPLGGGTLRLVMVKDLSVPVEAHDAITEAEAYIENRFGDDVTVKISVVFEPMGPDTLGATGTPYTVTTYNRARQGLQNGRDANDLVQAYLPSGSLLPVRYNGSAATVTHESRVFWTHANYKSTIGSLSGYSGEMTFNDSILWDFDPADGIDPGAMSFQDVFVHEVGHVLGFTSGVDGRFNDLEALDLFRFQRTDGAGDHNPDSAAEFSVRPRLVDYNNPNDNAVTDIVWGEYRMSDGDPWQASHFREQDFNIGLMDPALAEEESRHPFFFSAADLRVFDAIGWDR